jgi:hypothetical protein
VDRKPDLTQYPLLSRIAHSSLTAQSSPRYSIDAAHDLDPLELPLDDAGDVSLRKNQDTVDVASEAEPFRVELRVVRVAIGSRPAKSGSGPYLSPSNSQ